MIEDLEKRVMDLESTVFDLSMAIEILKRDSSFEARQLHNEIDIVCNKTGVTITPEDLDIYNNDVITNTDK